MNCISVEWQKKIRHWLFDVSLPIWSLNGFDKQTDLFRESLTFDAHPTHAKNIRARIQPRQLYVFSQAKLAGWQFEGLNTLIIQGFSAMQEIMSRPEGGWVHLLSSKGCVMEGHAVLYDQAFMILALSSLSLSMQNKKALEKAEETVFFLDMEMQHPKGGYIETHGEGDHFYPRRQNSHMHLLEAFLALYEASKNDLYLEKATHIIWLFERYFFDAKTCLLSEFFDDNWFPLRMDADPIYTQRYEAGHYCEWIFLLYQYKKYGGNVMKGLEDKLFRWSMDYGLDDKGYFVVDYILPNKQSSVGRRLWAQTEWLRAMVIRDEMMAMKLLSRIFESYLATSHEGLWMDEYTLQNVAQADSVPASTLYHLWGALGLCADLPI